MPVFLDSPDVPKSAITLANVSVLEQGAGVLVFFDVVDPYDGKGPSYLQFDVLEIWRTPGALGKSAAQLATVGRSSPVYVQSTQTTAWQYWFRARDKSGNTGASVPGAETPGMTDTTLLASQTGGVLGTNGNVSKWIFPGGLAMQCGTTFVLAGGTAVTFPLQFIKIYAAFANPLVTTTSPADRSLAFVKNPTISGLDLQVTNFTGTQVAGLVTWMAMGTYS